MRLGVAEDPPSVGEGVVVAVVGRIERVSAVAHSARRPHDEREGRDAMLIRRRRDGVAEPLLTGVEGADGVEEVVSVWLLQKGERRDASFVDHRHHLDACDGSFAALHRDVEGLVGRRLLVHWRDALRIEVAVVGLVQVAAVDWVALPVDELDLRHRRADVQRGDVALRLGQPSAERTHVGVLPVGDDAVAVEHQVQEPGGGGANREALENGAPGLIRRQRDRIVEHHIALPAEMVARRAR